MDGTENQKDTLQETGQSSSEENQGTSTKEAKTYSEEEVQKAVNDALAAKGRDAKSLTDKEAEINARQEAINAKQAEIDEWERQRDAAELEAAKGDPVKLREYQRKQVQKQERASVEAEKAELRRQREAFNRDKAEHEAELNAARGAQMEIKLWQIGEKYGVDPVVLKELNLPNVEQAEAVAKRLSKKEQRPPEGETEATKETKTFDSGLTSGNRGTLSPEQFEKLSASEKKKYLEKQ